MSGNETKSRGRTRKSEKEHDSKRMGDNEEEDKDKTSMEDHSDGETGVTLESIKTLITQLHSKLDKLSSAQSFCEKKTLKKIRVR